MRMARPHLSPDLKQVSLKRRACAAPRRRRRAFWSADRAACCPAANELPALPAGRTLSAVVPDAGRAGERGPDPAGSERALPHRRRVRHACGRARIRRGSPGRSSRTAVASRRRPARSTWRGSLSNVLERIAPGQRAGDVARAACMMSGAMLLPVTSNTTCPPRIATLQPRGGGGRAGRFCRHLLAGCAAARWRPASPVSLTCSTSSTSARIAATFGASGRRTARPSAMVWRDSVATAAPFCHEVIGRRFVRRRHR